jgi:hypothetical protein
MARLRTDMSQGKKDVDRLIDRVLWMPTPTLEGLSSELVSNQRKEHRYTVETKARLLGSSFADEQEVTMTNVSKSGVGLEASFPLEVGSVVTLITGTTVVSGQVRWCRVTDDAYAAGILAQRVGLVQ